MIPQRSFLAELAERIFRVAETVLGVLIGGLVLVRLAGIDRIIW